MSRNLANPSRYLPLLASIIAITPLAIDMYLPAMTRIAVDLDASISLLQQSLSIYLMGFATGMALLGPVADHFGRKRLLIIGLLGFTLSSLLLSLTNDIHWLLTLRFLQALCGGAASVVVPATVRLLYAENTAKGLSYVSMTMMIAPLIAPALGSTILTIADWPMIFLFIGSYALVILFLVFKYFPILADAQERTERQGAFHWLGILKDNYRTVLSNRTIYRYLLVSMLSSLVFFTYLTAIPFVYMSVFKIQQDLFSLLFGLNVIGLMAGNFLNAKLVSNWGSRKMLRIALTIALLSSLGLVLTMSRGYGIFWCVALVIPIMASVMVMINNSDSLVLMQYHQEAATASAVLGSLRFASGALAGPLLALSFNGGAVPFAATIFITLCVITGLLLWPHELPSRNKKS